MKETEIRVTCGSLAKTSDLIRSHRGDEQMKSQDQGGQVVARSKRQRMVVQNLTNVVFLSAVFRSCRSIFETVVASLIRPFAAQIKKMHMKPCFVTAALIIRSQAESFPRYRESTMLIYFPETLRVGWLEETAHVCRSVRAGSGSPQWWNPVA